MITRLRGDGWRYDEDAWAPETTVGWVSDVAVRESGNVLIFQRRRPQLLEVGADGALVSEYTFENVVDPHAVVVTPEGSVLLMDRDGQQVLRVEDDGTASVLLRGRFCHPTDVAVHPNGDLYVTDGYGGAHVHRFTAGGEHVATWGRHGTGRGEFNLVHALAIDAEGRILVADRENGRIQVFGSDGECLDVWDGFHRPLGIDLDASGAVVVSEGSTRLTARDADGRVVAAGRAPNIVHALATTEDAAYLAIPATESVVRLVRRPA
jgi:sugar lactone lactonase YvrE